MNILHIGCCVYGEPYSGIEKAFAREATNYRGIPSGHPNLEDEIIEITQDFIPDVVFCQIQRPDVLPIHSIKYLRSLGAWVANWTGDVRQPLPKWYIETGEHVNISLFSNMEDVHTMREHDLKAEYLQIGIDPEVFNPVGDVAEDVPPIVFMANNYKENGVPRFPLSEYRIRLVERMMKEFGDDFAVYGNGWEPGISKGDVNSDQKKEASIYRAAKISLNVSHFRYESYSSDRLFRIMASGGCAVSHWFPHMANITDTVPMFTGPANAVNGIKNLLKDDELREEIRARQIKEAMGWYTYDSMVGSLMKIHQNDTE